MAGAAWQAAARIANDAQSRSGAAVPQVGLTNAMNALAARIRMRR
jgi:hypothetical protein